MSTRDRRALVDVSDHMAPVSEQCKWLGISRSGFNTDHTVFRRWI